MNRAPLLLFAFQTTTDYIKVASFICYALSCFYLCRIYSGLAHEKLKTLKSCVLVDEIERNLKAKMTSEPP